MEPTPIEKAIQLKQESALKELNLRLRQLEISATARPDYKSTPQQMIDAGKVVDRILGPVEDKPLQINPVRVSSNHSRSPSRTQSNARLRADKPELAERHGRPDSKEQTHKSKFSHKKG